MKKALGISFLLLNAFIANGWAGALETHLAQAVRGSEHEAIGRLLASGANPNAQLPDESTVLDWAVDRQDQETVRLLLAAGARANALDPMGVSPLSLACELGDPAIVASLLNAGA